MDVFSKEKRSAIMRSIKGKDTTPEIILRKALFRLGCRFRLHNKSLPGTPDIVLKKYKTAIFIHGCFWHGHVACGKKKSLPKTRTDYWFDKIETNKKRDFRKQKELEALGWKVMVVYECQLTTKVINDTLNGLQTALPD